MAVPNFITAKEAREIVNESDKVLEDSMAYIMGEIRDYAQRGRSGFVFTPYSFNEKTVTRIANRLKDAGYDTVTKRSIQEFTLEITW